MGEGLKPDAVLPGFLVRPLQSLKELALADRWEVTRRHPYYVRWWRLALSFYEGKPVPEDVPPALPQLAAALLRAIGVSGPPLPPSTGPDDFRLRQMGGAWDDGAIGPLTFRALPLLLMELPWETRMLVATTILESVWPHADGESVDDAMLRVEVANKLHRLQGAGLDSLLNGPIIGVNLRAPRQTVLRAVDRFLTAGKRQESIPEVRRRPDKTLHYLEVWDLREGWVGDHYEDEKEQQFRRIAVRLHTPLATVMNRYRSAFRLISGHEYTFDNWFRLFVRKVVGPHWSKCLARRQPVSRRRAGGVKQIPESIVKPPQRGARDNSFLGQFAAVGANTDVADMILDLKAMLQAGWTTKRILEHWKPDHPKEFHKAVEHLREQMLAEQVRVRAAANERG